MKNFKFRNKGFLFCFFALFFVATVLIFSAPINMQSLKSFAECTKSATIQKGEDKANNFMYTGEEGGNIPFSLFISKADNGQKYITDYYPTFTSSTTGQNETSIYYYTMDESSRPYFLLSSNKDQAGTYNSTVFLKFNDPDGKTADSGSISTSAGYMSIEASVNNTPIIVERVNDTDTDNSSVLFAVNLKELSEADAQCPSTIDGNKLGGDGLDNNVSYRTGLYQFKIRYSYKDDMSSYISNECVFSISFYVLNYMDYIDNGASPFIFENTDTYYLEEGTVDSNYELYNYNYINTPVVKFNATKFGFNYTYTTGYTNYNMQYQDFVYNYTPERIQQMLASPTDKDILKTRPTGTIIVKLKNSDKTYNINTYYDAGDAVRGEIYYLARFDTKDFEQNFLVPNNINTTLQGTYSFNLDFLVSNATSFSVVDKSLFPADDIPEKINQQKLVIFGYELKYYDQDPNSSTYKQDVSLKNNSTWSNFIAYNSATTGKAVGTQTGYLVNIPNYIPITDQAPLRFHSFGNLTGTGNKYTSPFLMYDYKTTSEESIINLFKDCIDTDGNNINSEVTKTNISNNINSLYNENQRSYYQGASISGDGIRVMKLEYKLNLTLSSGEVKDVIGTQYVVFEINNTVQNLYIQSFNNNTTYDFDYYTNKNVRVNLEYKPNTFYAPVQVTYSYSNNYKRDNITSNGSLYIKKDTSNNKDILYTINDKNYNYYVTSQTNNYTFSNSGYYKVTIKNAISNVPRTYSFIIDKTEFSPISVNKVGKNDDKYVKSATTLAQTYLSDTTNYIKYDLIITNEAFTLGWKEKVSGAGSYSKVFYMEIVEDTLRNTSSLFKSDDNQYWLTNGLKLTELSSEIDNYKNSYSVDPTSTNAQLNAQQYFNKDGLYFFYVFDDAGNYFTRIVLIDSSRSTSLQGYWENTEEVVGTWINTYDPVNNPANYVNKNTTLYFGTHKVLLLPDDVTTKQVNISFEDKSFTRAYDISSSGNGKLIEEKPPIAFEFYSQVLNKLNKYVQTTQADKLIINNSERTTDAYVGGTNYSYLTLPNTTLQYKKDVASNSEDIDVVSSTGNLTPVYKIKIYVTGDPTNNNFNGEASYKFTTTNINGAISAKLIEMNFDVVQGTFYAYSDENERIIRKNTATNLDVLKFVYNKLNDETASYYEVKSLTFDYYEFILDDSSTDVSKTSYPFAKTATRKNIDLLEGKTPITNEESGEITKYEIDKINIDIKGLTLPGKYILTRTYKGGDYNYIGGNHANPADDYEYVGEGGSYYFNGTSFINLFELDSLTRKYVVYVDHNGIISSSYMVRTDNKQNVREIGDNISITLSNTYDDEWLFKEFFLTSTSTLSLDTNKVPVLINIPLSKYFVYYNSVNDNFYSKHNFAKLNIVISYAKNKYTEVINYVIDGFDPATGLCTCSKLVSNSNPNGNLIFSAQGIYTITITDNTGYLDVTSNDVNADNINPTTYVYSFEISHVAPSADMSTITYNYQQDIRETNTLKNEDGSNNFATNIKKSNGTGIEDNEVIISWYDSATPYNANVNQVNISVIDTDNKTYKISIDLKKYNLYAIASSDNNIISLEGIENSNYILYFTVDFYEGKDTPSVFDNKDYYRYFYTISVDISKEYSYSVELSYISASSTNQSYKDENGKSYAETLYKLYIDRTKPYTNINTLLQGEDYLKPIYSDINNFKEEKFDIDNLEDTPSAFTYAFGVSKGFVLNYDAADTSSYFYVRHYEDYSQQYTSITPDMIDTVYDEDKAYYNDFTKFSISYPRFAEVNIYNDAINIGVYTWYRINYNKEVSLLELITNATNLKNPTGFYEIIEKDPAGNYRCYTIYFSEYEDAKNYLTLSIDGYHEQGYSKVNSTADSNITASLMFEISELDSKFGWGTITIKNETIDSYYTSEIKLTPFDSYNLIQNRLADLNEFFKCDFDSRFSITLAKYNSAFPAVTRYINIITNESTAKLAAPSIEEVYNVTTGTTTYTLKFPVYNSKSVLYLESLSVNILEGKDWKNLLTSEGKSNIPVELAGLSKGIYKVTYKDNYNKEASYSYILYVGEYYINDFNKEFIFEYNNYIYDANGYENKGLYYSGGDINVTYEANIYKVWVNGKLYSGDSSLEGLSPTLGSYNCKTFTLTSDYSYDKVSANEAVGGSTYYEVVFRDITDNSIQKTYNFVIFNTLPTINLTNAYGGEVTSTLKESNSQINSSIVTLDWGKITNCEYTALNDTDTNEVTVGLLYTRNQYGEYKNGVSVTRGQTIVEEGYYKLQIINSKLGNYREIYFVIQFGSFPLYTVLVDEKEIQPSSTEVLNLTATNESNTAIYGVNSDMIIKILYTAISELGLNTNEFKSLKEYLGFGTDAFQPDKVDICNLTNIPHYYTVKNAEVVYNSNMELNIIEFCFKNNVLQKFYKINSGEVNPTPANVGSDYWTTIYLVYNLDGPIRIEFFALTKVPVSTSLLNASIYFDNEKTNTFTPISLVRNPLDYTLTNQEIKNSDITLYWNKLSTNNTSWYNQGNIIYVSDKYGVDDDFLALDYEEFTSAENIACLTSVLTGSGLHNLVFKDLAGNTHMFASNTYSPQENYKILLIDSVIYHINSNEQDYNPIQYGVFNDYLKLIINEEYLENYYDLKLIVTRNGSLYNGFVEEDNTFTFTNSGRYVVQISALYNKDKTSLNTAVYNFTILDSNSARLAYEFVEIPNYEIVKVLRNNEDITDNFRNSDGKVKSLFISSNSSTSGNGYYTVTLKYGPLSTNTITYSFYINNYIPTISCNIEHGSTTKGSIIISYNPSTIYEQLGVCYIKILTYNSDSKTFYEYGTITIDENSFTGTGAKEIEITRSNSYFIQVQTKSGNTISSFRVNRTDPLNAVAIIIISISVVAVIVLIIVVVKLRTKMKVR